MEYFNFFNGPILSVSELTHYLRQLLEADQVLQDIWVRGEISNFSHPLCYVERASHAPAL